MELISLAASKTELNMFKYPECSRDFSIKRRDDRVNQYLTHLSPLTTLANCNIWPVFEGKQNLLEVRSFTGGFKNPEPSVRFSIEQKKKKREEIKL